MSSAVDAAGRWAVVLLSGGLDSATAAAWARDAGFRVAALSVRYGQRHAVELDCAAAVAAALGLTPHQTAELPPAVFAGSALTDITRAVPTSAPDNARIPTTYVPARNLVFLSLAAAMAESLGATDLVIGANVLDYSGYPDCRRPFFDALERTLAHGTKAGSEGAHWRIHTPLIALTKAQIVMLGMRLGVPFAETSSCYDPAGDGAPCARCEACQLRARGFAEAGLDDPRVVRFNRS